MPRIRLLTSVQGGVDAPVIGDPGDELDVADDVADVWADGERAELVSVNLVNLVKSPGVLAAQAARRENSELARVTDELTAAVQTDPVLPSAATAPAAKTTRRRRTRPASA